MAKPVTQQNSTLGEQFKSLVATWLSPILMGLVGFFLSQTYTRLEDSEKVIHELERNQIRLIEKVSTIEKELIWLDNENIQIRKKIDETFIQQTQKRK